MPGVNPPPAFQLLGITLGGKLGAVDINVLVAST